MIAPSPKERWKLDHVTLESLVELTDEQSRH